MNKRLAAISFCLLLIVVSVFLTAFLDENTYQHQYEIEDVISTYAFEEVDDVYTNLRKIEDDDYCLDDYFFDNLAQEINSCSPMAKYLRIDDQLYLVLQSYASCVKNCQYIVKIEPLKTAIARDDKSERIVSYVDYSYLPRSGRYVYAIVQGDYSLKDIKSELSYCEKCLYSYDYEDEDYGHQGQLNEKSFVDYLILMELAYPGYYNEENYVVYKDNNNRFRVLSAGFEGSSEKAYKDDVDYHNLTSVTWFSMLYRSEIFTQDVIDEYEYLRKNILSNESINDLLNNCANFLLNNAGIENDEVIKEKDVLITYLNQRLTWLDENIDGIKQYSARSAVKEYNNKPY